MYNWVWKLIQSCSVLVHAVPKSMQSLTLAKLSHGRRMELKAAQTVGTSDELSLL